MNHHHHHHRRNIQIRIPVQGVPIELTPMDQFKTIFSIDNINFSIVENNKLLKANIDTFGSQALFIRKTKAYKVINIKDLNRLLPIEYLLIFIPIINIFYFASRRRKNENKILEFQKIVNIVKLYSNSFITMKYNINNILTSPDAHKISKEEGESLHKLIKYVEVMHFATNQLVFNKDIIKCHENSKNNKINKNSDNLCGESIKFEEMEARVNTIIEKLGSMIIAKSENHYTKITDYIESIINLKKCIAYNYHHSKFYNILNKKQLQKFYEEISFILCIANILLSKDDSNYTLGYNFNDSNRITKKL